MWFCWIVSSIAHGDDPLVPAARERAHERLLQGQDTAPTTAPVVVPEEQATLVVANDSDGTLTPQQRSLPLPEGLPGAGAGSAR